ncbi:MAG: hypothetical protein ACKOXB_06100 [Flavobacteriales bacterium]
MTTVFFFTHPTQTTWFTLIAESIKTHFKDVRIVVFSHGQSELDYARQYKVYDEFIDLIDGFEYNPHLPLGDIKYSPNLKQLEEDLNLSFFWEDCRTDRWLRVKNDGNFTLQYLNHAFEILHKKYKEYNPIFGYGESTMAIYRFAHRLFDRDNKKYYTALLTRYYKRFYMEDDWFWSWKDAIKNYHYYLENGIPQDVLDVVLPIYTNVVEKKVKPVATQVYNAKHKKGFTDFNWFNIGKMFSIFKEMKAISDYDMKNNVRYVISEKTLSQKLKRYFGFKKNHRDYLKLIEHDLPKGISYSSYFLHYQPEYTSDSLGKFYVDQQFLISNIAMSLPAGQFLVVKDHVVSVGLRPKSFYEHIKKNPNVILLRHDYSPDEIVKNSKVVFTIVGSVALEAMFIGKPTIMFGKYAFAKTNTISLCTSFWELGDMIRQKMNEKHDPGEVKRHALALLAGKYSGSMPGDIFGIERNPEEVELFPENAEVVKKSLVEYLKKTYPLAG